MGLFISLALLVAAFLMIAFPQCQGLGLGRKTMVSSVYGHTHKVLLEEKPSILYKADYEEPHANYRHRYRHHSHSPYFP
ncbi:hypothetical protein HAX54_051499 [Datura stramonium]|uniref:Uncharacterized protein n=1 Tax=Datura stramonium TaxID=4076 RepID=A0ABS8WRF9_DATST|nr:hypothetical protein [Datura stramonium]